MRRHHGRGIALQARIERRREPVLRGMAPAQGFEQVRRIVGQRERRADEWLGERCFEIHRIQMTAGVQALQQRIALCLQARTIPARRHQRRLVRQYRERRDLRPAQRGRLATEIAPRRGFETDHVATERRMARVQREYFVLAVAGLDAQREGRLDQLGAESAVAEPVTPLAVRARCAGQARELHRDGARTTDHATLFQIQADRARDRQRIDTEVTLEALVFEGEQRGAILLRHALELRKSPLAIRRDPRTEQRAVAREQHRRLRSREQRRRREAPEPDSDRDGQHEAGRDGGSSHGSSSHGASAQGARVTTCTH